MGTERTPIDYRQLYENAPMGIINISLDGTPVLVNEHAAHAFGYDSPEHFLAEVPSMFPLWVDIDERSRAVEIMLATGSLRDFEVEMRRRDGSHVVLSISANPWHSPDGEVIGIQVTGIDITDRIAAERRLDEAQAQASIGFWSWRPATREFTPSDQVLRILGFDPGSDIDTERIASVVHPDDRDVVEMVFATFGRRPNDDIEVEFRVMHPSGDERWLIARGTSDPDGLLLSGSLQDITKQKLVESKLQELNDMKTEFVGVVAHDLRSPLAVASGYMSFLRERWDALTDQERLTFVDNIERSLDRLGSLVSGVLEVTSLETGAAQFEARPFDLGELVRTTVKDIASTVPNRRCRVEVHGLLPIALADPEAVARVVTNLLSNALKYSVDEPVKVDVTRTARDIRVAVTDLGPGIAPADQSKLFQRFSRLPSRGEARRDGTGLGLFICRSLVEGWGGNIWVESNVGEGSTFFFTVPPAPEARAG